MSAPTNKMSKENNHIEAGKMYSPRDDNPTTDNAYVLGVKDGIVRYERISTMKVIFCASPQDFERLWII